MAAHLEAVPVTCVITSYNNRATLNAAINSVLCQSQQVSEIIVADDGSTDGSQAIIRQLAAKAPGLRPVLREKNVGVAANRDMAIRVANYPFVTHLDGDDMFAWRKIESEWAVLQQHNMAVAYSCVARVYTSRFWRTRILDPAQTVAGQPKEVLANLIARRGSIPRDMLLAKSLFEKVGGFDHSVALYEDWQFKLKLAALGVEWRHSGALGTLYIEHTETLSGAERNEHDRWKRHVVHDVFNDLRRQRGEHATADLLNQAASRRLLPNPRAAPKDTTRYPVSGQERDWIQPVFRPSFRSRLTDRLRIIRFIAQLWKTFEFSRTKML